MSKDKAIQKQTLVQKVVAAFSKMTGGKELLQEIKDFKLSLEEVTPDVKPDEKKDEVKMMEVKTKDGKVISYTSENLDVNTPVTITNADGSTETDGEYTLENGDTLTVAAGVVTAVKKAEAIIDELPVMDLPMLMAKLSAQKVEVEKAYETKLSSVVSELTKKIEVLTAQNLELTKATSTLLKFNKALIEIPVEEKEVLSLEDFDKLTPLQKRRAQKENA